MGQLADKKRRESEAMDSFGTGQPKAPAKKPMVDGFKAATGLKKPATPPAPPVKLRSTMSAEDEALMAWAKKKR